MATPSQYLQRGLPPSAPAPCPKKRPAAAAAASAGKKAKAVPQADLHASYASKLSYASSMSHKAKKEAAAAGLPADKIKTAGKDAYSNALIAWG